LQTDVAEKMVFIAHLITRAKRFGQRQLRRWQKTWLLVFDFLWHYAYPHAIHCTFNISDINY